MESDARYYARRSLEEARRAARAMTPQARAWHAQLSEQFAGRAAAPSPPPCPPDSDSIA